MKRDPTKRNLNQTVTLYIGIRDSSVTPNLNRSLRVVLTNCQWQETSGLRVFQSGILTTTAMSLMIPRFYLDGSEFPKQLLPREFTAISLEEHLDREGQLYTVNHASVTAMDVTGTRIERATVVILGDVLVPNYDTWYGLSAYTTWVTNTVTNFGARSITWTEFHRYGKERHHHAIAGI